VPSQPLTLQSHVCRTSFTDASTAAGKIAQASASVPSENLAILWVLLTVADKRQLLTIPEAAELLRVSTWTIRRYIANGQIPALQLGGRRSPVRIPADELREWMESP
jgi:excisionase family DNA binding protein